MHIEELKEVDSENIEDQVCGDRSEAALVVWDPKRVLVGAAARVLFYPTLVYNVVRNMIQSEFRWWDRVDEFVLLGAVPFPTDVPRLKALGVRGVITLNEPYETLVSSSLYLDYGIEHLVIPTRDYLFAPSQGDISQAVEFIHGNAVCGKTTYVHCKAGRGRSTTVVLCYLVKHKEMSPEAAYEYVRSIRPRVLLASSQWQVVQDYYHRLKKPEAEFYMESLTEKTVGFPVTVEQENIDVDDDDSLVLINKSENINIDYDSLVLINKSENTDIDDDSLVLITKSDLDGYEETRDFIVTGQNMLADKVYFTTSQTVISKLSCFWLRYRTGEKVSRNSRGVDIHAY